jgi:hypothetical protein
MRNIQGQSNVMPGQTVQLAAPQAIAPATDQAIKLAAPTAINPGIKQSGAPVTFSPQAQNNMTGMFGTPVANSYDRSMGGNGFAPPTPTVAPIVPTDNLYNL